MRQLGILLAILLVLPIATGIAEAKTTYKIQKNLREIKDPTDTKSVKITMITKPRTMHFWYVINVAVCAGFEKLYSPDLVIKSDRDTIEVTVWGLIMPNTCKSNEFFIAANDPSTISVDFASPTLREPAK
ncbi:MAG: hypothetical protein QXN55_05115 [Candidatus Nitrosotenuis sp.]|jgi:hypothetical protein